MGVFDIIPGLGGGGDAAAEDSGDSGDDTSDPTPSADLTPDDFRERAEALTRRSDVPTLDFTVESLEALDGLAAGPPSAVDDAVAYGSYLGETIVREYDAEWVREDGWQVSVESPGDWTTIAVFGAAEMSIADEPVFAGVADRLEAEGAERSPDDLAPEADGDGSVGAKDDEDEVETRGGEDGVEAATAIDADGAEADAEAGEYLDADTVVVDEPPVETDGVAEADSMDDPTTGGGIDAADEGPTDAASVEADGTVPSSTDAPAASRDRSDDGTVAPDSDSAGVSEGGSETGGVTAGNGSPQTDHEADGRERTGVLPFDAVADGADGDASDGEDSVDDGPDAESSADADASADEGSVDPDVHSTDDGPADDASTSDRSDVLPVYEDADGTRSADETIDAETDGAGTDDGGDDPTIADASTAVETAPPSTDGAVAGDTDPVQSADGVDASEVPGAGTPADRPGDDGDDAPLETDPVGAAVPGAPERYVLRTAAEELADGWPSRDLDFTPSSLPRLDAFVDDQWDGRFRPSSLADRTVDHEDSGDPLAQIGAYYGEVLVRWLDGEWVPTDDGEGAIAVPDVGEKVERVDVFAIARECLAPPSTFAYRYDALVNRLYVDKPAVSDGRAEVFDDDRASLTAGDVITQFAETAEAFIEAWPEYPLDYTPRSVRALDEIAERLSGDLDAAGAPLADGTDPESLWLTARATAAGAYFAAVLVRHRDAQWRIGDDVELVVDGPDGERTVDPVAAAADCLRGEGSFVRTYRSLGE